MTSYDLRDGRKRLAYDGLHEQQQDFSFVAAEGCGLSAEEGDCFLASLAGPFTPDKASRALHLFIIPALYLTGLKLTVNGYWLEGERKGTGTIAGVRHVACPYQRIQFKKRHEEEKGERQVQILASPRGVPLVEEYGLHTLPADDAAFDVGHVLACQEQLPASGADPPFLSLLLLLVLLICFLRWSLKMVVKDG